MSLTAIILFLVIIVLLVIMYLYFFGKTMIDGVVPLKIKAGDKPYEILYSSLESPDSVRYYYSFWVYIDNNIPADVANIIFRRGNNFILILKGRRLYLVADSGATAGSFINGIYQPSANDSKEIVVISDNFQFQRWVHVIVAVDGKQVDVYMDGKMVKTVSNTGMFIGESTKSIEIGNMNTEGKITRFDYSPLSMNPQQANAIYLKGSGQSKTGMDEYGVNLVLKYKNIIQSKLSIS